MRWANLLVQRDRCLSDAPLCLFLPLGAQFLFVLAFLDH
jgi:hypothetical protein